MHLSAPNRLPNTRQALLALLLSSIPLRTHNQVQAQAPPEPPFVAKTFSFGWGGVANSTMIRCRVLNITITPLDPSHLPLGPFDLGVYSQHRAPLSVNAGTVFWNLFPVDLDIGGPYLFSMTDAYGGTGGTSESFNVVADPLGLTCGSSGMVSSGLQLNVSTPRAQCEDVPFSVTGGTPPYTMTVLPESSTPKTVSYNTGNFNYTLDLRGGVNAFFSVQDALGIGAVSDFFTVAEGTDASCLGVAPTLSEGSPALSTIYAGAGATPTSGSSTNTTHQNSSIIGPVIGGVVGSLFLVCLGLILGVYFYKRRREAARNWETSLRREGLQAEPLQRLSIDGMSSSARRSPEDDLMMKQGNGASALITPYNPSPPPIARPVSYGSDTTNWNSAENIRPLSGPTMMMIGGPMSGGGGGEHMMGGYPNAAAMGPYPGGGQHPQMAAQGQVVYSYSNPQHAAAQHAVLYPPQQQQQQQQQPQASWHPPPQGQPNTMGGRPTSDDFGGSTTVLSNVSGSGAGEVADSTAQGGSLTQASDEKRGNRSGSAHTSNFSPGPGPDSPSPPYQPNQPST